MCEITGYWGYSRADLARDTFEAFTHSLAHRGPDGFAIEHWRDARLWLGHRRLEIIDLSDHARQPLSYANGRYWITYNVEIYNYLELREELAGLGHRFVSNSDTEVVVAAYAQWNAHCHLRFNGMWAFAIWDAHDHDEENYARAIIQHTGMTAHYEKVDEATAERNLERAIFDIEGIFAHPAVGTKFGQGVRTCDNQLGCSSLQSPSGQTAKSLDQQASAVDSVFFHQLDVLPSDGRDWSTQPGSQVCDVELICCKRHQIFGHLGPARSLTECHAPLGELSMVFESRHGRTLTPFGSFIKQTNTTLADLFTLPSADPSSAMRTSLMRQSNDELDDGVAHGWQDWPMRRSVDSFFPRRWPYVVERQL